jgi:hypothetical protein
MTDLFAELNQPQENLLRVISGPFMKGGRGPNWRYIENTMRNHGYNARETIESLPIVGLPNSFGSDYSTVWYDRRNLRDNSEIRLTIAAALHLPEYRLIGEQLVRVIRFLADRVRMAPADPYVIEDPFITAQDVEDHIRSDNEVFLAALPAFLQHEPVNLITSQNTSSEPIGWTLTLGQPLLGYEDVSSVRDYVQRTMDLVNEINQEQMQSSLTSPLHASRDVSPNASTGELESAPQGEVAQQVLNTAQKRGFLIMPFDPQFDSIRDDIDAASVDENLDTKRGDDVFAPGIVLEQILKDIDHADVVFAVCTGMNPNVFFELGYTWRRHKPILIAQSKDDLPFNIQHARTVLYGGSTSNTSQKTFVARLRKAIRAALEPDELPLGRILTSPPMVKQGARLTGRMQDLGQSKRFLISNTGTVDIRQVNIEVPSVANNFKFWTDDLPVDILRSGENFTIPVAITMGNGKSIFDLTLRGVVGENDEPVEFFSKVSI